MNIKEAKEEIIHTVQAYTAKDEEGNYRISSRRQRPLLLIGPPGIGKTAVMEQAAAQCEVGLVAYTITHHTRQSAVGLPLVEKKVYGGKEYTVTEYTMSEIIAAVYEQMELTGKQEGILFIDEINCVSETLAPTMLQFLQCKTFGNHKIPQGWVIAAAGNPSEYNKSARELDMVTLDRVRCIQVEADVNVWREYAQSANIHGAVLSYLEVKPQNFYHMEAKGEERQFVTARGWEDLAELLREYERMNIPVTEDVIGEYLQCPAIAEDFASYYRLYRRYQGDYPMGEVLDGTMDLARRQKMKEKLQQARIDERLGAVQLLLSGIHGTLSQYEAKKKTLDRLHQKLTTLKTWGEGRKEQEAQVIFAEFIRQQEYAVQTRRQAGVLGEEEEKTEERCLRTLRRAAYQVKEQRSQDWQEGFEVFKEEFQRELSGLRKKEGEIAAAIDRALEFVEEVWGEGQEMLVFLTDLTRSADSGKYLQYHPCPRYFAHSGLLMVQEQEEKLRRQLEKIYPMGDIPPIR